MQRHRTKLLLLNVAKTGGTTLTFRLVEVFAESEVAVGFDHLERDALGHVRKRAFESYLRNLAPNQLEKISIFAGHLPAGVQHCVPYNLSYVGFFRNPVARLISGFLYGSATVGRDPEWIKFALHLAVSSRASHGFDNPLTRTLSANEALVSGAPGEPIVPVTLGDREAAIRFLRSSFFFVGLTERFEESCEILFTSLGKRYQPNGEKLNVTPVSFSIDDLPEPTLRAMERGLEHDIAVYNEACRIFNRDVRGDGMAEAEPYRPLAAPCGAISSGDHCHLATADHALSEEADAVWMSWPYARKTAEEFIGVEYTKRRGCRTIGIQVLNEGPISVLLEASDDGFLQDVRRIHRFAIAGTAPKVFNVPEHDQAAMAWRLRRIGEGAPLRVASLQFDRAPYARDVPALHEKVARLLQVFHAERPT